MVANGTTGPFARSPDSVHGSQPYAGAEGGLLPLQARTRLALFVRT